MLPSILAKQLQKGINDYLRTTFSMTNAPFKGSLENMMNQSDTVYHEPYICVRLPFRVAEKMPDFVAVQMGFKPYMHQSKAFARLLGNNPKSTLIATGTGSGKTECFTYPILEYCYQHRGEQGIKALIIYPMNALASDQAKRLAEEIWKNEGLKGKIRVGMYVGEMGHHGKYTEMGEKTVIDNHEAMLSNPPDILLTNYKMLDYLLLRPQDSQLWNQNTPETLKYIAVDELHTFDGAQGTDLACLLRRLKARLSIPSDYLCCVGTSATMGGQGSQCNILDYAKQVFGEQFVDDSVIGEDRLTPNEFLLPEQERVHQYLPNNDEIVILSSLVDKNDEEEYLKAAVKIWFPELELDVTTLEGRVALGEALKRHVFFSSVMTVMGGRYCQNRFLLAKLEEKYAEVAKWVDGDGALNSLFALVSHARLAGGRPFLNVQVQLWMRELRRLLATVRPDNIQYSLYADLNDRQKEEYLPVVNCRECGATGWAVKLTKDGKATIRNIEAFYNDFFKFDQNIALMFPADFKTDSNENAGNWRLCPVCKKVELANKESNLCEECNVPMMDILIPKGVEHAKYYECPFCHSHKGLSLMGLRSTTATSAEISQIYTSKFNDDKKLLAFSDSVQDAAHRAGFFNARTWRNALRSAIQMYVKDGGAGRSLPEFADGFCEYWHGKLSKDAYAGIFMPPNMVWMEGYDELLQCGSIVDEQKFDRMLISIDKRLKYEIMLEYGVSSEVGRTLPKSRCSALFFSVDEIKGIGKTLAEYFRNNPVTTFSLTEQDLSSIVWHFLDMLRKDGAFADSVYNAFCKNEGNRYLLSPREGYYWLPAMQLARNVPIFLADKPGKRRAFSTMSSRKYLNIALQNIQIYKGLVDDGAGCLINKRVLEELIKVGYIVSCPLENGNIIYGLNKDKVYVTDKVVRMVCDKCGTRIVVPADNMEFTLNGKCPRRSCEGILQTDTSVLMDYYGQLYSNGDLFRINAKEHTGLLEGKKRDQIENEFKAKKENTMTWYPNLLSCTPTLEMGIDIGDLSTVVMCSMPPAQAQFLQRAGRAGRKDGNAFTLAIANARPHDLYFYAEPLEMIEGTVETPRIFLSASAVLERQFIAFALDSWVHEHKGKNVIPQNLSTCLFNFGKPDNKVFPFDFLEYVQKNVETLYDEFINLFVKDGMTDMTKQELKNFALVTAEQKSPMYIKIYDEFLFARKQQDSIEFNIRSLQECIKELEARPKDTTYEEQIKNYKDEKDALQRLKKEDGNRDIFNFMSDNGLLPNYAFPETGVSLKAVLRRKESEKDKKEAPVHYEKIKYNYSRPASAAIGELALNNNFYAEGHKFPVNQIDVHTTEIQNWRLCPKCSYMELANDANDHACPICGSGEFRDQGQLHKMLKVRVVYANGDYRSTLIDDESDNRTNTFYTRKMLVNVKSENIVAAYRIGDENLPFGYEYASTACLREINFGEASDDGNTFKVAGQEEVCNGFYVCKSCGKMPDKDGKFTHAPYCKHKNDEDVSDLYPCIFLYRELNTEVLRVLIPDVAMTGAETKTESFVAAFMLGMKAKFGNVDHLRATVTELPGEDDCYCKQYLVLYDSVPGGTGYLKQLTNNAQELIDILQRAYDIMQKCSCNDDDQKDGCYHCLYTYRQQNSIGNVSRNTASKIFGEILNHKDKVEQLQNSIGEIKTKRLLDSKLEEMFLQSFNKNGFGTSGIKMRLTESIVNQHPGFRLTICKGDNDVVWDIKPQVYLDSTENVWVDCKPDFVFYPVTFKNHKSIAVFTDGYTYHAGIVAEDIAKRNAVAKSDTHRVWSLTYADVMSKITGYPNDQVEAVFHKLRNGISVKTFEGLRSQFKVDVGTLQFDDAMLLLIDYLSNENAEADFVKMSKIFAIAVTKFAKTDDKLQGGQEFGLLKVDGFCNMEDLKNNREKAKVSCTAEINNSNIELDNFKMSLNTFWHFFNLMQFNEDFDAKASKQ